MLDTGYDPSKFQKPIFYFDPQYHELILSDHIWAYRQLYNMDFCFNCIDWELQTTEFEITSNDQLYYIRSKLFDVLSKTPYTSLVDLEDPENENFEIKRFF